MDEQQPRGGNGGSGGSCHGSEPGTTTVTALATNGQALRCAVTVNSDVGKVTLNKRDLLLRTVGSKEALTASVAVEDGTNVPITMGQQQSRRRYRGPLLVS